MAKLFLYKGTFGTIFVQLNLYKKHKKTTYIFAKKFVLPWPVTQSICPCWSVPYHFFELLALFQLVRELASLACLGARTTGQSFKSPFSPL